MSTELRLGSVLRMATGRVATLIRIPDNRPYYTVQYHIPEGSLLNQATFTPEAFLGKPSVIREILA